VLCEPKRWRAKIGEIYYYICYDWCIGFYSQENREEYCNYDDMAYERGNYFKSRVDADNVAKQLISILDAFKNK
jgi:hypothetical protein